MASERGEDQGDSLTAFAPFEAEKTSRLPYVGGRAASVGSRGRPPAATGLSAGGKPKPVVITDTLAPPRIHFRNVRTPTPTAETSRATPPPPSTTGAGPTGTGKQPRIVVAGAAGEGRDLKASAASRRRSDGGGRSGAAADRAVPRPAAAPTHVPVEGAGGSTGTHKSSAQEVQPPQSVTVTKSVVLTRIGTLEKQQNLENDLKRYWMPDKACKECSDCQTRFNIIVRKHHCRICGRIFCNSCCSNTIPGYLLRPDLQGNLRVCKECLDIFQEFHTSKLKQEANGNQLSDSHTTDGSLSPRSTATTGTPTKSQMSDPPPTLPVSDSPVGRGGSGSFSSRPLGVLSAQISWDNASSGRSSQEIVDLSPSQTNVEFDNPGRIRSISGRRPLTTETEERLLALEEDEVEFIIEEVWQRMMHPELGLVPQNHRHRFRSFLNSYSARHIVEWLIRNGYARSSEIAVNVAQGLVDTKRLKIISSLDQTFRDENNLFLEPGEAASIDLDVGVTPATVLDAPKWFHSLPEDGESEPESALATVSVDSGQAKFRYSRAPSMRSDVFLESRSQEPNVTLTSVGDIMQAQSEEDYLIINRSQEQVDTFSDGDPLAPMMRSRVRSGLPSRLSVLSSATTGLSPQMPSMFTVISNQDVFSAIPVGGLSSAAAAARDISTNKTEGKTAGMASNEDALAAFRMDHDHHFDSLMIQLIQHFGLSLSWLRVVKPLILEAVQKVQTNVFVDDVMEINEYVKVKKIAGGRKSDSSVNYGVVCTKNVTHKKMSHHIRNPSILLLKCAFEWQRRENQLSSFDTLQHQEERYLKNVVARIEVFKPKVILVQKSVSRLALEMLHELGIVVAVNVKPSVMMRVARSTQGDLLHSLDQLFLDVRLGTCGQFYVRGFTLPDGVKKTLMYFSDCDPKLGCAITLQGGLNRELKKVKKVTQFGLHIAHNSHFETAFLVDSFAWMPNHPPLLLPDVEHYSTPPSTPEWPLYPSLSYPLKDVSPGELARRLSLLEPHPETKDAVARVSPQFAISVMEEPKEEEEEEGLEGEVLSKDDEERGEKGTSGGNTPTLLPEDVVSTESPVPDSQNAPADITPTPSLSQLPHDVASRSSRASTQTGLPDEETLARLGEKEFKLLLEDRIISISPNVVIPAPYLQTPVGMRADIRRYLPRAVYWSYYFRWKSPNSPPSASSSPDFPKRDSDRRKSREISPMEMGVTQSMLQQEGGWASVPQEPEPSAHDDQSKMDGDGEKPRFSHSYKSVSEHPLTSSIFLLSADSDEMKAALADYRARAGLVDQPNCFFFPEAQLASDYQYHLNNLFKQYRPFGERSGLGSDEGESGEADATEPEDDGAGEDEVTEIRPVRRRVHRTRVPENDRSGNPRSAVSKRYSEGVAVDVQECTDSAQKTAGKGVIIHIESTSKLLENVGTLEDLDRGITRIGGGTLGVAIGSGTGGGDEGDVVENLDMSSDDWSHLGTDTRFSKVDCLDPCNHQGISILFSSTCHDGQKHQLPCVPPCIIPMSYYGRNDISLGEFLQRYCFRPYYRCQTCGVDMESHQRHVVHGLSALHISVEQAETTFPGEEDFVYSWLTCTQCAQCTPFTQVSKETLQFSFAKFLELKFHGHVYLTRYHSNNSTDCSHSLHREYVHYFCFKNKIAAFEPCQVSLQEVLLPPRTVVITTPHSSYHLDYGAEVKHISRITEGVFHRIKQKLLQYNVEPIAGSVKELVASCKAERDAFRQKVKRIKHLVVSGGFATSTTERRRKYTVKEDEDHDLFLLQDLLSELKRALTEVVECWNINLESLDTKLRVYVYQSKSHSHGGGASGVHSDSPTSHIEGSTDPPDTEPPPAHSRSHTPKGSSTVTPLQTPVSSPDSSSYLAQTSSSTNLSGNSGGTSDGFQLAVPATITRQRSHSRNLSDSGLQLQGGSGQTGSAGVMGKDGRHHKRQLSDSSAPTQGQKLDNDVYAPKMAAVATIASSGSELSMRVDTPELDGGSSRASIPEAVSETELSTLSVRTPAESVLSSPAKSLEARSEGVVSEKEEEEEREREESRAAEEKLAYQRTRSLVTERRSPQKVTEEVSDAGAGGSGAGLLAKLRGKDAEGRDDPTKYYLLESAETKNSPQLGVPVSRSILDLPLLHTQASSRPHRRPNTIPRKALVHSAVPSLDTADAAKNSERRAWRDRGVLSRPFQKLPTPFELHEHHNMHSSVKIPTAVYEREPTSLIAYALNSREYQQELKAMVDRKHHLSAGGGYSETKPPPPAASPKGPKRQASESEKSQHSTISRSTSTSTIRAAIQELKNLKKKTSSNWLFGLSTASSDPSEPSDQSSETTSSDKTREGSGGASVTMDSQTLGYSEDMDGFKWNLGPDTAGPSAAQSSKSGHISLEFTDKTASFFCKVYFAEEFYTLRELIFPDGEDRFVRALSRCVKYDAQGGKTRATFCKTIDDRFILKQIRSVELSSLEQFAPHYISHVTKAIKEGRPLVLAKILGVYTIGYKNGKTGNSKRLDVIVMENLLYGHTSQKVFDLKGSMRSRYIDPSKERSSEVLLDENYLNYICYNPVYVYPHSKCALMQAILEDSQFLARNSIMDYSLLTCIDEETGELVVGIIDYVRTFTLDKRLEMYLKKTAGRGLPTVVYPELYRKRFCDAMERYFTVVPDKWTGLGTDISVFH